MPIHTYSPDMRLLRLFSTSMERNKKTLTFYEILKVRPDSSSKEIKLQYYKLCKLSHPDTTTANNNRNNSAGKASTDFHNILKAYETLKDPLKRKEYDRTLTLMKKSFFQPHFSAVKEFQEPKETNKTTAESMKFWSKMNQKKDFDSKDKEKENISERLKEFKVFRNRILVFGAILIGYWISSVSGH